MPGMEAVRSNIMIKSADGGKRIKYLLFPIMIWLLAFQSPLESVHRIFAYTDEITACIGAAGCVLVVLNGKKFRLSKDTWLVVAAMAVFMAVGLLGNLLYRYQPLSTVLVDLFTNFKFFFAIAAGYFLFGDMQWDRLSEQGRKHARIIALLLFCIFLLDRVFNFWPAQVRYGIKSARLFFFHPTYLAGAMVFLVVLLTAFYEKKNLPCIAMAVLMMAFTLRSKAIASAAAFMMLFVFAIVMKRKINLYHLAALGGACFVIGLPFIWFYYFSVGLKSVRAWLTVCSVWIMRDYFPIGTGFGTFASAAAAERLSPVYYLYNMEQYVGAAANWQNYLCDTFWPIIFGQTGAIGTCAFLIALCCIGRRTLLLHKKSSYVYVSALFALIYLLIGSTSEPSFHNSVAVPLALMCGIFFRVENNKSNENTE